MAVTMLEETAEVLRLERQIEHMTERLRDRKNRLSVLVYEIIEEGKWV